jgi:hypothetical protein
MKGKYFLYGFIAVAAAAVGVMAYLVYFADSPGSKGQGSSVLDSPRASLVAHPDRGKSYSGKPGRLVIAYAGDVTGSLGPCG